MPNERPDGADASVERAAIEGELLQLGSALRGLARRAMDGEVSAAAARGLDGGLIAGRYRLRRSLGATARSTVHLARDERMGQDVALKLAAQEGGAGAREALRREAAALARLDHPGVVHVFDVQLEPEPLLVMAYLPGPTLERVLALLRGDAAAVERDEPASVTAIVERLRSSTARLECAASIAEALAYCHDREVLHRDVKPANVVFDEHGRPCLVDLGLAWTAGSEAERMLQYTDGLHGTPGYLAPEQLALERTGAEPSSDLFALAVLVYELVTLRHPFQRETVREVLDAIERDPAPSVRRASPTAPAALDRVLQAALSKRPAERHTTVAAFARDLRAVLDGDPISIGSPRPAELARALWRRWRQPLLVVAAATAVGLAAVGLQTAAELRRVAREIESTAAEVTWTGEPPSFATAGAELVALAGRADQLEETLVGRLLAGATPVAVRRRADAWADEVVAAADAALAVGGGRANLGTESQWAEALAALPALCPDRPPHRLLERGRIGWPAVDPAGGHLAVVTPVPFPVLDPRAPKWSYGLRDFRPAITSERPGEGYFRLRLFEHDGEDAALVAEFDLAHRGAQADAVQLAFGPGDAQRFEWTEFGASVRREDPPDGSGGPVVRYRVPAFALTAPITVADYRRYCAEAGVAEPRSCAVAPRDDVEVFVDWEEANRFAAHYGCRLPDALEVAELHRAVSSGVERSELLADPRWTVGEWITDLDLSGRTLEFAALFDPREFARVGGGSPGPWCTRTERHGGIRWELVERIADDPDDATACPVFAGRAGQAFRLARSRGTRADLARSTLLGFE